LGFPDFRTGNVYLSVFEQLAGLRLQRLRIACDRFVVKAIPYFILESAMNVPARFSSGSRFRPRKAGPNRNSIELCRWIEVLDSRVVLDATAVANAEHIAAFGLTDANGNDSNYVSAIKTRADGTQYVTISFSITNFAGTTTKISIDFNVTTTAKLIKVTNQVSLPYIDLSITLKKLLGM
jgi:hypothetical protein